MMESISQPLAGWPTSIPAMLTASAERWPDRPALWRWVDCRFEPVSYRALTRAASVLGSSLAARGATVDRHVAIAVSDRFSWGMTFLGVMWSGSTAVPIDPALTPTEVAGIVREADASMIVTDSSSDFQGALGAGVTIVRLGDIWPGFTTSGGSVAAVAPSIHPDSLASILFTSGTTGAIKGVMLSHANIVSDIAAIQKMGLCRSTDKLLSILPIHHAFECTAGFLYPLSIGAQVAYARSLKSQEILGDLRASRATVILGVPLLFEKMQKGIQRRIVESPTWRRATLALLGAAARGARAVGYRGAARLFFRPLRRKAGLDSLRLLVSGGAALPHEVAQFYDEIGIPLLQGYGLSEASPVVSVNRPTAYRYDTVGPPLPLVEVSIRDRSPDGIGEIAVKGPMIMRGYWRKPAETAATIRDGWLLTGDLGTLENDGHLKIFGRSKNVIISGAGKNIYPEEIEAVLGMQPEIAESVVYGLSRPGKIGEAVAAIIVPDPEWVRSMAGESHDDESAIRAGVDEAVRRACARLAPFKRVTVWDLRREPFERTGTRKIKRAAAIRSRAASALPRNALPDQRAL